MVGVDSCLGVVLILLFRILASLPADPDTCCPVGVCLCVPVLYLRSNMKGEPNSQCPVKKTLLEKKLAYHPRNKT